jgi:flavin-dependent dehydrogenase
VNDDAVQVAIIGGGTAGSALALLLARAGLSVTVIEEEMTNGWKVGEGLPPSAKMVLLRVGVWERFLADGHLPSHGNRSIWGSSQVGETDFLYDRHGHGWHLDRSQFDRMLAEMAVEAGATRLDGVKVTDWQADPQAGWQLSVASRSGSAREGQRFTARLVVDATGRKSWWARQMGVERLHADHLCALAGVMQAGEHSKDRDSFTMIESVRDGWWYTALLPGQQRVVALLSDGDLPAMKQARDTAEWRRMLRETEIGAFLQEHGYELEIEPQMRTANSSRLRQVVGDSWLAVGDSAAAYDPLSSQGILLAIGTAIESSQAILKHLAGDEKAFTTYAHFIDGMFQTYLLHLIQYYDIEQRFPDSPFWKRRSLHLQKA